MSGRKNPRKAARRGLELVAKSNDSACPVTS